MKWRLNPKYQEPVGLGLAIWEVVCDLRDGQCVVSTWVIGIPGVWCCHQADQAWFKRWSPWRFTDLHPLGEGIVFADLVEELPLLAREALVALVPASHLSHGRAED